MYLLGTNNLLCSATIFLKIYLEDFRDNLFARSRKWKKKNIFITTLIPAAFHFDTNTDLDIQYFCSKVKTL
jgi:hypothetical protein